MQELLIVNPSDRDGGEETLYESNPRRRRRSGRRASAKQAAWRREFGRRYGGRKRRASNPSKRRRKSAKRGGSRMVSVKRGGHHVSRRAWRASGYRRNPSRRRHYRRNPIAVRASLRSITATLVESAQGAVGAIGVDMLMGQIVVRGWLPATMLTTTTYPLVKGGVAIGLGILGNMMPLPAMLKRFVAEGVRGSLTCTLRDTITPYVSGSFPLGARVGPRRLGYMMPGRVVSGRQMGEYLHGAGRSMAERESSMYGPGYVASQMGEYLSRRR